MFTVTSDRRPGIYRYSWTPKGDENAWYAEDFTTWLEEFAAGGPSWRELLPQP